LVYSIWVRGILGHKTLAGVGFSEVVVWLEGCILGRFGENEGVVDLGGADVGLDGAGVGHCPTQARGLDSL